jgi:hypothetical protein
MASFDPLDLLADCDTLRSFRMILDDVTLPPVASLHVYIPPLNGDTLFT